jgi:predicted nucleic acid-binding protein
VHFVDTNVVLRLFDRTAPEHEVARHAVAFLESTGEALAVGLQVLVSTWVVATRPVENNGFGWSVESAQAALDATRDRFILLSEDTTTADRWAQVVRERAVLGKHTHDARIVALMATHGVARILTFNAQDFATMPNVIAVHPQSVAG